VEGLCAPGLRYEFVMMLGGDGTPAVVVVVVDVNVFGEGSMLDVGKAMILRATLHVVEASRTTRGQSILPETARCGRPSGVCPSWAPGFGRERRHRRSPGDTSLLAGLVGTEWMWMDQVERVWMRKRRKMRKRKLGEGGEGRHL
jgi:hypothetical protein